MTPWATQEFRSILRPGKRNYQVKYFQELPRYKREDFNLFDLASAKYLVPFLLVQMELKTEEIIGLCQVT